MSDPSSDACAAKHGSASRGVYKPSQLEPVKSNLSEGAALDRD